MAFLKEAEGTVDVKGEGWSVYATFEKGEVNIQFKTKEAECSFRIETPIDGRPMNKTFIEAVGAVAHRMLHWAEDALQEPHLRAVPEEKETAARVDEAFAKGLGIDFDEPEDA